MESVSTPLSFHPDGDSVNVSKELNSVGNRVLRRDESLDDQRGHFCGLGKAYGPYQARVLRRTDQGFSARLNIENYVWFFLVRSPLDPPLRFPFTAPLFIRTDSSFISFLPFPPFFPLSSFITFAEDAHMETHQHAYWELQCPESVPRGGFILPESNDYPSVCVAGGRAIFGTIWCWIS